MQTLMTFGLAAGVFAAGPAFAGTDGDLQDLRQELESLRAENAQTRAELAELKAENGQEAFGSKHRQAPPAPWAAG